MRYVDNVNEISLIILSVMFSYTLPLNCGCCGLTWKRKK